jgi:hypothetical protein
MNKFSKYVCLDVHQETIAVALADTAGEVRYMGEIANTPEAIATLVTQLKRGTRRLPFCYEAGPCGYTICRQLRELKQECQVVAPSLIVDCQLRWPPVLFHGIMLLPGNCHSPMVRDEGWCRVAVPAFIASVSPSI